MIDFDTALARVISLATPLGTEMLPIRSVEGRVLAEDIVARNSMPACNVSAMDGYAVRESDIGDLPCELPISGESFAGSGVLAPLAPHTTCRIFTGAPVPDGCDRVIVQENVERIGDLAHIVRPYGPGRHIRAAGSDFLAGDVLLPAGRRLDWKAMTSAAAADREKVKVYRQPQLSVIATGDELAEPGFAHERLGAIPESVSFGIAAFARSRGAHIVRCLRLPDDPEKLSAAAQTALVDSDVTVVIGGASVGEKDYSRGMFGATMDYVFPKVAIKPGKPVWLARAGGQLVLGLPGNPTAALVTARLFLAPLLEGLGGVAPETQVVFEPQVAASAVPATGNRETFYRAVQAEEGVCLVSSQDSSSQCVLSKTNRLIRRSAGSQAAGVGDIVEVLRF